MSCAEQAQPFSDAGRRFVVERVSTCARMGHQATCDRVEASVRSATPTGPGFAGCAVTRLLSGELR